MLGLEIGNLKDILTRNPLKYGDALGLTYGPLSGRAPGKLTDRGLDWQQKANPGISRRALESSNDIAPYVAGAIATFGGSAAGELPAAGEGGYSVVDGAPAAGADTGAFDMYGSQSSPTDSSTIFDGSRGTPTQSEPWWRRFTNNQSGGLGSSSRSNYYQAPQDQQPIQPVQMNSYAQQAIDNSRQMDPATQYWLDRANQLRYLAGSVASRLYGAPA